MAKQRVVAGAGRARLVIERSGLLADDTFGAGASIAELGARLEFHGSAPAERRSVEPGAHGLSVRVQPHGAGVWEGSYAVSRSAFPATSVFHVVMRRDPVGVAGPDQSGEAVFAVQTASTKQTGVLNYVVAASTTNSGSTRWLVGHAKGLTADASLTVLWFGEPVPSACAAFFQEITLRTDGRSRLETWFGPERVYAADRGLDLEIDPPLQAYLEVQALEIGYTTTFTDYWVTEDDAITVCGARPDDIVRLVDDDGSYREAVASSTGQARVTLRMPKVRGRGTLRVGGADGLVLGPFPYAGGDAYRLIGADGRSPR